MAPFELKCCFTLMYCCWNKWMSEFEMTCFSFQLPESPCRPIFLIPFAVFAVCFFLQRNYSAPFSRRGYHSCDYDSVAKETAFATWGSGSALANVSDQTPLDLRLRGRRGNAAARAREVAKEDEALLTGRWVSTLPFLQGDIIDCDVALNARSSDSFQYHLGAKTSWPP